jgi:hypothetical protein
MVRLVFRPYTQVRRSICTLESLRTSTRVSPGFVLLKHSSPSFGSQHICSHSNLSLESSWSVDSAAEASYLRMPKHSFSFNSRLGFDSRTLAHMLDSLVRVSRRVDEKHFVRVTPEPDRTTNTRAFSPATEASLTCMTQTSLYPAHCFPAVPFQQFHVLFHSLFKVLFIFPSRYLFAIGLLSIFSVGRNLPPALSCNPKQLDSLISIYFLLPSIRTGLSPSTAGHSRPLYRLPMVRWLISRLHPRRFSVCAFPASLAVTEGILVSFFSSA